MGQGAGGGRGGGRGGPYGSRAPLSDPPLRCHCTDPRCGTCRLLGLQRGSAVGTAGTRFCEYPARPTRLASYQRRHFSWVYCCARYQRFRPQRARKGARETHRAHKRGVAAQCPINADQWNSELGNAQTIFLQRLVNIAGEFAPGRGGGFRRAPRHRRAGLAAIAPATVKGFLISDLLPGIVPIRGFCTTEIGASSVSLPVHPGVPRSGAFALETFALRALHRRGAHPRLALWCRRSRRRRSPAFPDARARSQVPSGGRVSSVRSSWPTSSDLH